MRNTIKKLPIENNLDPSLKHRRFNDLIISF